MEVGIVLPGGAGKPAFFRYFSGLSSFLKGFVGFSGLRLLGFRVPLRGLRCVHFRWMLMANGRQGLK